MIESLEQHATAISALLGTALGGGIAFITSRAAARRDLKIRLFESVFQRRMDAHEQVLELCRRICTMVGAGGLDESGEVARHPAFLHSSEAFNQCFAQLSNALSNSHWFRAPLLRELNLFQDYLVTLNLHLEGTPEGAYPAVGGLIRQDFVDFAASIQERALLFFTDDLDRLDVLPPKAWHKFEKAETERRLSATQLLKRSSDIALLKQYS